MAEDFVSVEEAAERLDLSAATVRRMCAAGELSARRVGRRWVIPVASLRSRRRGRTIRRGGRAAGFDLETSCSHVLNADERERWVPDILRLEDWAAARADQLSVAAARLDGREPYEPATPVEVPKSSFFTRTGHLLSFPDMVAYQSAVGLLAPSIEARLAPTVFSSRLSSDRRHFLIKGRDQWLRWKQAVVSDIRNNGRSFVICTDITAYFDSIRHDLLLPELQMLADSSIAVGPIREMLRRWAEVPNNGLPQGPNASRVLANFFLIPVDDAMNSLPAVGYFRYMDDIRITAPSRAEAIAALRQVERACKLRGLALSAQKTRLLIGDDAINDIEDEELTALQYDFDLHADDVALRKRLGRVLASAIRRQDDLNERRARFSLWRLHRLRDDRMLRPVLANLETLTPLGQIIVAYLRPCLSTSRTQRGVTQYLENLERNTSAYFSAWLFALMLDSRGALPESWLRYSHRVGTDRNQPSWHRALALNVMALDGRSGTHRYLREVVSKEHDPELVRAGLVGLLRAGSLDRAAMSTATTRFSSLRCTVGYLRGRQDLPSLILPSQRVFTPQAV